MADAAPAPDRRRIAAWCLYDFANSAFPTVVTTFVFAAYYIRAIAPDAGTGTAHWGFAMGAAGFVVAVLSPLLGAVADRSGRRKAWLGATTALCVAATACLWFARPEADAALLLLGAVVVATVAFELGMVFYNAMLNDVAPPDRIGRVSGWGWGLGYAGGLLCLVVALVVFIQPVVPPFGLDGAESEEVRATALLVALWYAVFAVPLFLFVAEPARPRAPLGRAIREGLSTLGATLRHIGRYRVILRFLVARMLYTDGLITLFAFGGIYAAGTFGMALDEVIQFGIALNVTAGLGAAGFAWLDDRIGPKTVILVALGALIVLGGGILVVEDAAWFWALGLGLGIFVGPAQAASRSLMARLVPREIETEMFGLYALSGKATAFVGPLVLGLATEAFASQRAGMATILVFFAVGGALLIGVKAPEKSQRPRVHTPKAAG